MSKRRRESDELREEYDFSPGERGKYAKRFRQGCNVVVLDPDIAEKFESSEAVNQALRDYLASQDPGDGAA